MKKTYLIGIIGLLGLLGLFGLYRSGNIGGLSQIVNPPSAFNVYASIIKPINSLWKFQIGGTSTSTAVLFCDPAKGCYHSGDVMFIGKNKNIGIGTVSPNTNLLINSTANTASLSSLQLYNSIGTVGQVGIGFRVSTSVGNDFAQIRADRTNSPSSGDSILEFFNTKSTIFSESMRIDTAGRVGIGVMNTVTWGQTLNVAGNAAFYHSVATGTVPTLATSTGAGAHSQKSLIKGHDANGIVQITTAGSPSINASVFTLTFGTAYATIPSCTFSPYNDNSDILSGVTNVYGTSTVSTFSIVSGSTGLTAAKKYMWAYQCEE